MASAVTGALVAIWLRKLSSSEHPAAIGIYYNSLGSLLCVNIAIQFLVDVVVSCKNINDKKSMLGNFFLFV